jgi:Luciferase-like monooxygenase
MRFGLDIAQQRMPWDEVVSRVQFAEALGFDGAWGFDHFQPMYGEGPGEAFDGLTTLAVLTGVTSQIRLGLLVTGVTYRHPSVFAAQALTIDHASHGRFELSLGAAWFEKEHRELGIPFPPTRERFDLLEDALEIVTRLFTGDVVTYDGRIVSLRDAQLHPLASPAPAPADLGRRQRSAPHAPPRRPLRGRLARVGYTELVAGGERTARPPGGRSRPQPVVNHASGLTVARRPRHRAQARNEVARRRLRLSRLRLARGRSCPGGSIRQRRPARVHPLTSPAEGTRRPSSSGGTHGRSGNGLNTTRGPRILETADQKRGAFLSLIDDGPRRRCARQVLEAAARVSVS